MTVEDLKAMFSSASDNWTTPPDIYDKYMEDGYIDPCPYLSEVDNLGVDFGAVRMFINPPYSDIKSWVKFAIEHHRKYHKEIIFLVPARTDTQWFHELLCYGVDIQFIKGRLKFGGSKNSAPFPSIYIKLINDK